MALLWPTARPPCRRTGSWPPGYEDLLPRVLAATAAAFDSFDAYVQHFGKTYASDAHRDAASAHFEASKRRVAAHNARALSWRAGLNQFSDMSDDEFEAAVLMDPQECSATGGVGADAAADLPTRSTGGRAASSPSEQQLVDCAGAFDTKGCAGGLPSHAFEYVKYAGGLSTEFSYPYRGVDQACAFNATASSSGLPTSAGVGVVVPGGSVNITKGDEVFVAASPRATRVTRA
ncbi:transferase [Aureococcus anophagefferens]|nr:transferase [Aureococcus anophagefferens]